MSRLKKRTAPEGAVKVYTIKFDFAVTDIEARKFIHKPNCETSKALKKYLFDTLKHVCKQIVADSEKKSGEK
nr:MAG TPA: hypothetical protein [Caudoviricetes sp.]